MHYRRTGWAFAFEALIALDTAVGGVAGFALFIRDLDAADAAVTGVDHLEVVDITVGERHPVGCVSAGAVRQHREELLLGLGLRRRHHRR